jgi:hypothetical protein
LSHPICCTQPGQQALPFIPYFHHAHSDGDIKSLFRKAQQHVRVALEVDPGAILHRKRGNRRTGQLISQNSYQNSLNSDYQAASKYQKHSKKQKAPKQAIKEASKKAKREKVRLPLFSHVEPRKLLTNPKNCPTARPSEPQVNY